MTTLCDGCLRVHDAGRTIDVGTGTLTPITGSPFAAGLQPASVAVDPSGKFAYVANSSSNDVSAYTINASTDLDWNKCAGGNCSFFSGYDGHALTQQRGGVAEFFPKGTTPSNEKGGVYGRQNGVHPRAET